MNDSMSLGIHRLWKDSFVSAMLPRLPPSIHQNTGAPNPTIKGLDVAGGTGDIAFRLLDRARERFGNRELEVEIVDLNEGMLREGEKRVAKTMYFNSECTFLGIMRCELIGLAPQITFTHGNAQTLPKHIADNSIDIYTIAFGIRNCTSLPAVLSEAYRVLKPGGKIGVLEFGKVRNALLRQYDTLLRAGHSGALFDETAQGVSAVLVPSHPNTRQGPSWRLGIISVSR